jgi:hypothetical protein
LVKSHEAIFTNDHTQIDIDWLGLVYGV